MKKAGYEVRLLAIEGGLRDDAAHALSRVFGIDVHTATQLLSSLPRVVKRDTSEEEAERIARALEAIGGRAEVVQKPLKPAPVMIIGSPPPEDEPEPTREHVPESWRAPARAPQTVVGEPARDPAPAAIRHSTAPAALRTSDTITLGSQDVEALGLRSWRGSVPHVVPIDAYEPAPALSTPSAAAPTLAPISMPAIAAAPAHELAPAAARTSAPAPAFEPAFEPIRSVELSAQAESANAPALELAIEPPAPAPAARADDEFEVTRHQPHWHANPQPAAPKLQLDISSSRSEQLDFTKDGASRWRNPLALRYSQPPAAVAKAMRAPTQRARPPLKRATKAVASMRPLQSVTKPLELTAGIWKQAEQGSWKQALSGHPVAGFVFVLGATTAAFLLIFAVI